MTAFALRAPLRASVYSIFALLCTTVATPQAAADDSGYTYKNADFVKLRCPSKKIMHALACDWEADEPKTTDSGPYLVAGVAERMVVVCADKGNPMLRMVGTKTDYKRPLEEGSCIIESATSIQLVKNHTATGKKAVFSGTIALSLDN